MKEQKITLPKGYALEKVSDTEYRVVPAEKQLPKTWDEFCKKQPYREGEGGIVSDCDTLYVYSPQKNCERSPMFDKTLLPSTEKAEAIIALCQLIQLRDFYNDGWKPDWTTCKTKYCLALGPNGWYQATSCTAEHILSFKTAEVRSEFALNFKDLLAKLTPLFE